MKLPMDGFLDGQNPETTMIRGATTRPAPIDQGNAFDPIFVSFTASQRAKARVEGAIFKEVANLDVFDGLYGRGHDLICRTVQIGQGHLSKDMSKDKVHSHGSNVPPCRWRVKGVGRWRVGALEG